MRHRRSQFYFLRDRLRRFIAGLMTLGVAAGDEVMQVPYVFCDGLSNCARGARPVLSTLIPQTQYRSSRRDHPPEPARRFQYSKLLRKTRVIDPRTGPGFGRLARVWELQ